jgi:hypothetical protein
MPVLEHDKAVRAKTITNESQNLHNSLVSKHITKRIEQPDCRVDRTSSKISERMYARMNWLARNAQPSLFTLANNVGREIDGDDVITTFFKSKGVLSGSTGQFQQTLSSLRHGAPPHRQ